MKVSPKIKKRKYLIDNLDNFLDALSYYKVWSKKIQSGKSVVLWKNGQKENYCNINEIT